MAARMVEFQYFAGLKREIFRNPRLRGSWDAAGRYSDSWTESPMRQDTGPDGCPMFTASVSLDTADQGCTFKWGVILDGPQGTDFWGIPTEVQDINSAERYRQFRLDVGGASPQVETYYLTYLRRLGANKHLVAGRSKPRLRFAVWAPNAISAEVIFGDPSRGYIADDGSGIDASQPVIKLTRVADGIWEGLAPGDFDAYMSAPYMYRIVNAQGVTVYRTDIFSRNQIGSGGADPASGGWSGTPDTLDGTVSCSMVIDPDVVRPQFASATAGRLPELVPATSFWSSEFNHWKPVPTRLEDLIIYEINVGSLGFGKPDGGNLADAIAFLDHLVELNVNAVELMPMAETSGVVSWGYGDTHYLCIQSSAGGRDKYRHFVRECHRRGIAVIQDVVYNHYDYKAVRSEWQYDSALPEQNIYYWYEGRSGDYSFPEGGYLDNGSSGWAPRFWENAVRQQFISSAVFLVEEMHVDGLRVDLTQALHRDNRLHADGSSVGSANIFGQKLLREWSRTLRMIHPTVMLIAEDYAMWDQVTKPAAQGGLGFDAIWETELYHNLIGDSNMANGKARLLRQAGFGGSEPLQMDWFAGALHGTSYGRLGFPESHDHAGNDGGTARTIVVAVNGAPLVADTRSFAESRVRVCAGLMVLSAATPMIFMAEECGAQKLFKYDNVMASREDILGDTLGSGRMLFRFYQELFTLRRRLDVVRTRNIDIVYCSNANRVIGFKRWSGGQEVLVVASLNNEPFANGYVLEKDAVAISDGDWKEVFNSDAVVYGGRNIGNGGGSLRAAGGRLNVVIPGNGFVVLVKQ